MEWQIVYRVNLSAGFVTPPRRILLTRVTNRMAKTSNLRRFVTRMTRRVATAKKKKKRKKVRGNSYHSGEKKWGEKSFKCVCRMGRWGVGGWGGGDRHLFQCEKQQSQSSKWARKKSPQWENSYLSHLCGKTVISATSVAKQLSQSPLWQNSYPSHLCGKTVISVTSVAKQLSQSPLWQNSYLCHLCGKTVISVTSVAKQLSQSPLWQNSYLSHLCGKTVISATSVAKQLSQSPLWQNSYLSHLCGKTVISVTSVGKCYLSAELRKYSNWTKPFQ